MDDCNIINWKRELPWGVSKIKHYNTLPLDKALEECSDDVSILVSLNLIPVFTFLDNFKHETTIATNGNYLYGYYKNVPIYCDVTSVKNNVINVISKAKCATIFVA